VSGFFIASQNITIQNIHAEGREACGFIMCLWLFLWRFCAISLTLASIGNSDTIQSPMNHPVDEERDKSGLVFSDEWGVLGPFAIGTRGNSGQIKV
jgi:hypothetical protein